MRFLGIDFGERRVGLAISDADGRLATAWQTLDRRSDAQIIGEIAALLEEEGIGAIVVGEPKGASGDAAQRIRGFAGKLQAATGLPLRLTDETLTSREAAERLRGRKSKPGRLDALAAQILLQQALDEPACATPLTQGEA